MKIGTLAFASVCVIVAIVGAFLIPSYISSNVTANIELAAKLLWIGFWTSTFFVVYFWAGTRRLRKEARLDRQVAMNTSQIATDIDKMEQTLIRLFCIVYTPDEHSTPDARRYPAWRSELFKINQGSPTVLRCLKRGICPILPQLGTRNPLPLAPFQREEIMNLLREHQIAHAVR